MKYAVVVEKLSTNYCAHAPDLPVCVTTGITLDETVANMRLAIAAFIESCHADGTPVPEATTHAFELEVA